MSHRNAQFLLSHKLGKQAWVPKVSSPCDGVQLRGDMGRRVKLQLFGHGRGIRAVQVVLVEDEVNACHWPVGTIVKRRVRVVAFGRVWAAHKTASESPVSRIMRVRYIALCTSAGSGMETDTRTRARLGLLGACAVANQVLDLARVHADDEDLWPRELAAVRIELDHLTVRSLSRVELQLGVVRLLQVQPPRPVAAGVRPQ
eukprot:1822780-Prymnesium_polylepis.1